MFGFQAETQREDNLPDDDLIAKLNAACEQVR